MGRPTILRISDGIKLDSLDPKFIKSLVGLIGPFNKDGEPQVYSGENDIKESTYNRMLALADAFTFMLSARGCKQAELCDIAKKSCELLKGEITADDESAKKTLGYFAQSLIDILAHLFDLSPEEAKKQLNRAEQYHLLTEVRADVATLAPIPGKDGFFLLQHDKPIQAFTEKTIDELKLIKSYASEFDQLIPDLPDWFQKLNPEMKVFLIKAKTQGFSDTDIRKMLNNLIVQWKKYKDELNSDTIECIHNFAITKDEKFLPVWLQSLPEISQQLLSDCFAKGYRPSDIEAQATPIGSNSIPDTFGLPAWYFFLEEFERGLLVQSLNLIKDLHDVTLSSRLRSLPGIANAAIHSSKIIKSDGTVVMEFNDRYRGAHLASRDNYLWPLSLQGDYLKRNVSLLPREGKLHVTTLISPHDSYWARQLTSLHPDSWLNFLLKKAFESQADVDFVNLPVNYYGGLLPWQKDLNQLVKSYSALLEKMEPDVTLPDLGPLLKEAVDLLDGKYDGIPSNAVNLRLAAILHIVGQRLGYTFGSCVSGKDRYALLLAYSDAMMEYYFTNGHWPAFQNGKDKQFISLLMKILRTNHQSLLANFNAEGSEGLKNLRDYLAIEHLKDIFSEEDKEWIYQQDMLASANELKVICKWSPYETGGGERLFRSIAIGAEQCGQLNKKIHGIVHQKKYWESEGSSGIPEGISQIQSIYTPGKLPPASSTTTSFFSFFGPFARGAGGTKKIQYITSRAPELVFADVLGEFCHSLGRHSYGRGSGTQKFYDILQPLSESISVGLDICREAASQAYNKLDKFFDEIKIEHVTELHI